MCVYACYKSTRLLLGLELLKSGTGTYLAIVGAIALQGPHQVAKASRTTIGFLAMASLNSATLLYRDIVSSLGHVGRRESIKAG